MAGFYSCDNDVPEIPVEPELPADTIPATPTDTVPADTVPAGSDPVETCHFFMDESHDYYWHGGNTGRITITYPISAGQDIVIGDETERGTLITFKGGEFDLNTIPGNPANGIVQVPGPLLGYRDITLTFPDSVCKIENDFYQLYVTYKKSGDDYYFHTNYLIKNFLEHIGKWDFWGDWDSKNWIVTLPVKGLEPLSYKSSPFIVDWETSAWDNTLPFTPSDFLRCILNTPNMSSEEYGLGTFRNGDFSFTQLYMLLVSYLKVRYECGEVQFSTIGCGSMFRLHTFSCEPLSGDCAMYYINPARMFKASNKNVADMYQMTMDTPKYKEWLSQILLSLSPELADGIKINSSITEVTTGDESVDLWEQRFADEELAKRFVKAILYPLLNDESNRERLIEWFTKNPSTRDYAAQLTTLVKQIDTLLESTTKMEFGFSRTSDTSKEYHDKVYDAVHN